MPRPRGHRVRRRRRIQDSRRRRHRFLPASRETVAAQDHEVQSYPRSGSALHGDGRPEDIAEARLVQRHLHAALVEATGSKWFSCATAQPS